jgi:hypothetical protein
MSTKLTCPSCGTQFTKWREKRFCSEPCRKKASNARYKASSIHTEKEPKRRYEGRVVALRQNQLEKLPENQGFQKAKRRYEAPLFQRIDKWTWKATIRGGEETVAWLMDVDGYGWFAKRKVQGSEWTYGPTTLEEAKEAVKDFLRSGDTCDWIRPVGSIYTGHGYLNRYAVPPSLA